MPATSGTLQFGANAASVLELIARSAPVIRLNLAVYYAHIHEYTWHDTKSGQSKTNKAFRAILIDRQNPSQYLMGSQRMKRGDEQALKELTSKLKDGLDFKISKISLDSTKQEYISTPKKLVISLASTLWIQSCSRPQKCLRHSQI